MVDLVKMTDTQRERIHALQNAELPLLARYTSFQDFVRDTGNVPEDYVHKATLGSFRPDFIGNVGTWDEARDRAQRGSPELGRKAQELIEQMDTEGLLSTGPTILGPSVVGFVPLVPAYLAGHPESMLAKVESNSVQAPLRVFAGIGAGGGVSADQMLARGIAIAGLVLCLNTLRPVELYAFTHAVGYMARNEEQACLCVWPVETRPLDLDSVALQLAHPIIHRCFGFVMRDWHLQSPSSGRSVPCAGRRDTIAEVARIAFEAEPQDLVIPRATNPGDDPLIDRPLVWLRDTLAEHLGQLNNV